MPDCMTMVDDPRWSRSSGRYTQFLAGLKTRIGAAQFRASVVAKRELVLLYWQIGHDIPERQQGESCRVLLDMTSMENVSWPNLG